MHDKISVIVPIYNVEKYLKECLDSIINQTYKNLEILLINDGSTDNSYSICNEYSKKDSRIRVINQKNKGIAFCRNLGLKNITGKYVIFIDSDDYINEKMIESLYKLLKTENADIAMCSFDIINNEEENSRGNIDFSKKVLEGDEKFKLLYIKDWKTQLCAVVIWNKLYNRRIFKNIKYPNNTIHEDEALAHTILDRADKIVFTNQNLYYYRKREGSITNKPYTESRQDILPAIKKRYEFFYNTKRFKLASEALKNYCFFIIKHYKLSIDNNIINKTKKKLLFNLKDVLINLIKDKYIDIITKCFIICFYIFPNFTIKFICKNRNLEL